MVDQESRSLPASARLHRTRARADPAAGPGPAPAPATVRRPLAPNLDDEDAPKPLYRDEYPPQPLYRGNRPSTAARRPRAGGERRVRRRRPRPPSRRGRCRRTTRPSGPSPSPRGPAAIDEETTTILARSGSTARGRYRTVRPVGRPDEIDDYEDEADSRPIGERARWALAIGAVAAVVVLGLAIGYAVLGVGNEPGTVPPPADDGRLGRALRRRTSASEPPTTGGVLLTDDSMLSAAQAKRARRQAHLEGGAHPARAPRRTRRCRPASAASRRTASPSRSRRSCGCSAAAARARPARCTRPPRTPRRRRPRRPSPWRPGRWAPARPRAPGSPSGRVVRGVGDQSAGAIVAVVDGKTTSVAQRHRQPDRPGAEHPRRQPARRGRPAVRVADALAEVTKVQCAAAGGKCAGDVQVRSGPPPLGGDEPGFLATGDLPPVGGSLSPWNAAPIELPEEDFVGRQLRDGQLDHGRGRESAAPGSTCTRTAARATSGSTRSC